MPQFEVSLVISSSVLYSVVGFEVFKVSQSIDPYSSFVETLQPFWMVVQSLHLNSGAAFRGLLCSSVNSGKLHSIIMSMFVRLNEAQITLNSALLSS